MLLLVPMSLLGCPCSSAGPTGPEPVGSQLKNSFPRNKWKWKLSSGQPGWREVEREDTGEGDLVKPGVYGVRLGECGLC